MMSRNNEGNLITAGVGLTAAVLLILSSRYGQEYINRLVKDAVQEPVPVVTPNLGVSVAAPGHVETMSPAGYDDSEPSIKFSTLIGGTPVFIISNGVYGDRLEIPELGHVLDPEGIQTIDLLSFDELSQLGITSSEIPTNTAYIKWAAFTDSGEPTIAINQLTIDTDENGMPAVNFIDLPLQ